MKKKTYYQVSSAIFAVVAVAHAFRAYQGLDAVFGDVIVPMWFSWAVVIVAGFLAYHGFMLAKKVR